MKQKGNYRKSGYVPLFLLSSGLTIAALRAKSAAKQQEAPQQHESAVDEDGKSNGAE